MTQFENTIVDRAAARLALRGYTVTDGLMRDICAAYQPGLDANNLVEIVDGQRGGTRCAFWRDSAD